jgi:hypothetical protein
VLAVSRSTSDQTNYRKSVDQLVLLLQILDCDVRLVVRSKTA